MIIEQRHHRSIFIIHSTLARIKRNARVLLTSTFVSQRNGLINPGVRVHLWISLFKSPNRWPVVSRLTNTFTFLLRTDSKQITVVGHSEVLKTFSSVLIAGGLFDSAGDHRR
jgi:hypothetical protein